MDKEQDEALYNQQKDWEKEQEYYAIESAKAEADIKAQEEEKKVMEKAPIINDEQMVAFIGEKVVFTIRKGTELEVKQIVKFVDSTFTKEGYGFVSSAQINTEIKRGSVWVAVLPNETIIGVRIGIDRVYNIAVHPDYRMNGIGRALIEQHRPETIRVKSSPVGHLSKAQIENFKNPEGFYDLLGYKFEALDFARNFWQRGKGKEGHFHKEGKNKHIKIYRTLVGAKAGVKKENNGAYTFSDGKEEVKNVIS